MNNSLGIVESLCWKAMIERKSNATLERYMDIYV